MKYSDEVFLTIVFKLFEALTQNKKVMYIRKVGQLLPTNAAILASRQPIKFGNLEQCALFGHLAVFFLPVTGSAQPKMSCGELGEQVAISGSHIAFVTGTIEPLLGTGL